MKPLIRPDDVFAVIRAHPEPDVSDGIRQFRALATARQYRWPYAIVQHRQPAPARVLDWGCGNGHFSQFLSTVGYRVDSFAFGPPSPLIVALRNEQPDRVHYREGSERDPVSLPYDGATFDAVASVGVLEHVRETGGTELGSLREIYRVLKPQGLFFCFHFPNRYSWIEGMTFLFPSRHHHTYRYTKNEIRALAAASGFEVLDLRRYNVIPRNIFVDLTARWGSSRFVASLADMVDATLGLLLNPFAQNYGFVLRKSLAPRPASDEGK